MHARERRRKGADSPVLRFNQRSGTNRVLAAAKHNLRELRAARANRHIDASRRHLNVILAGPSDAKTVAADARRKMQDAGIDRLKLRKNASTLIEALFCLRPDTPIDELAYFADCVDWAKRRFGAENILSAVVHYDESAPHCHVMILPVSGSKLAASRILGNSGSIRAYQEDFRRSVCDKYDLSRKPQHLSVAELAALADRVLATIEARNDGALTSGAWRTIRHFIDADPMRFAEELGLLEAAREPTQHELESAAEKREVLCSVSTGEEDQAVPVSDRSTCEFSSSPRCRRRRDQKPWPSHRLHVAYRAISARPSSRRALRGRMANGACQTIRRAIEAESMRLAEGISLLNVSLTLMPHEAESAAEKREVLCSVSTEKEGRPALPSDWPICKVASSFQRCCRKPQASWIRAIRRVVRFTLCSHSTRRTSGRRTMSVTCQKAARPPPNCAEARDMAPDSHVLSSELTVEKRWNLERSMGRRHLDVCGWCRRTRASSGSSDLAVS